MKKFVLFFLFVPFLFSQETKIEISTSKKKKVLIVQLKDSSDRKKFPASKDNGLIMFYSLYSFIGILPQVEITNKNDALKLNFRKSEDIYNYAKKNNLDYVIYGEYEIKKEKKDAEIEVKFNVWSLSNSSNVISKTYNSIAGVEIFDIVDDMIKVFLKDILKIDYKIATVNFKNFDIGNEKFDLFVNENFLTEITNSNFELSLKVLPEITNLIEIKRKDGTNAISTKLFLKPYTSIDFSYTAMGNIKINQPKLLERNRKYKILIDNEEKDIKDVVDKTLAIKAGRKHTIELKDDLNKTHLKEEFYLKDGELKEYTPIIRNTGLFHFKAYTFDRDMFTTSAEINLGRYFWVGLGTGFTYFKNENIEFAYVSPMIEAGYFFLNDKSYFWRVGCGIDFKYYYKLSDSLKDKNYIPEQIYSISIFLNGEVSYLLLKPAIYFCFDEKEFFISYGLGLGLNF